MNEAELKVNDFQIRVATINGTGSQTSNTAIIRTMFRMGIPVNGKNIFPSNIKGLPTWFEIRVNKHGYLARKEKSEILVAMNEATIHQDVQKLPAGGICIYDSGLTYHPGREDITYYPVPVEELAPRIIVPIGELAPDLPEVSPFEEEVFDPDAALVESEGEPDAHVDLVSLADEMISKEAESLPVEPILPQSLVPIGAMDPQDMAPVLHPAEDPAPDSAADTATPVEDLAPDAILAIEALAYDADPTEDAQEPVQVLPIGEIGPDAILPVEALAPGSPQARSKVRQIFTLTPNSRSQPHSCKSASRRPPREVGEAMPVSSLRSSDIPASVTGCRCRSRS